VGSEVEPFEDLADGQALLSEPAIHPAHQVGLGIVDDEMAGHARPFGYIAIPVRRSAAQVLASPRSLQLAAAEPLAKQCPLVLGNGALDLEQQLVTRVLADGPMDEQRLAPGTLELLQQQDLVHVLARQAVGAEHDDATNIAVLRGIAQAVQTWPIQASTAVALVLEDVLIANRVALSFDPGSQHSQLALDGLFPFLALRRDACVDRHLHQPAPNWARSPEPRRRR
jgi:hypothetical protein